MCIYILGEAKAPWRCKACNTVFVVDALEDWNRSVWCYEIMLPPETPGSAELE